MLGEATFQHCHFRHADTTINYSGNPEKTFVVEHCEFDANNVCLHMERNANARIVGNKIHANDMFIYWDMQNYGPKELYERCKILVQYNEFYDELGFTFFGGLYGNDYAALVIKNNDFHHNRNIFNWSLHLFTPDQKNKSNITIQQNNFTDNDRPFWIDLERAYAAKGITIDQVWKTQGIDLSNNWWGPEPEKVLRSTGGWYNDHYDDGVWFCKPSLPMVMPILKNRADTSPKSDN